MSLRAIDLYGLCREIPFHYHYEGSLRAALFFVAVILDVKLIRCLPTDFWIVIYGLRPVPKGRPRMTLVENRSLQYLSQTYVNRQDEDEEDEEGWGNHRPYIQPEKKMVIYTPTATRKYERAVKEVLRAAYRYPPMEQVEIDLSFFFAVKKKKRFPYARCGGDLDNLIKAILDASQKVIFKNDRNVVSLTAKKLYAKRNGLSIHISTLTT